MIKDKSHREKLLAKISTYLRKKSLINILASLLKSNLIGIIIFAIFSLSETLFYFSPSIKTTFILILLLITIGSFFIFSVLQIKKYFKANVAFSENDVLTISRDTIEDLLNDLPQVLLPAMQARVLTEKFYIN